MKKQFPGSRGYRGGGFDKGRTQDKRAPAPKPRLYSEPVEDKTTYIFGKNVVLEALKNNPKCIEKVFLEKDKVRESETDLLTLDLIKALKIKSETMDFMSLPAGIRKENFQGIGASINLAKLVRPFKEFIENLEIRPDTCLVILGELEDVGNVGSIIRSAAALGASGILVPEHGQAQINGTVIKVSSGNAFTIPLVSIGNVNQAIETLKEKRFWIYGLDMSGEKYLHEENFTEPTVFIVGNEGDGIREKTLEHCDMILKIPMNDHTESLNAAVSTAVALYEWKKQVVSRD